METVLTDKHTQGTALHDKNSGRSMGVLAVSPHQRDLILLFLHAFLPKSARVGGRCPPPMGRCPPPQREILDPQLIYKHKQSVRLSGSLNTINLVLTDGQISSVVFKYRLILVSKYIDYSKLVIPIRSNTRCVHLVVTPSAARQLNHTLRPHRGIKGCRDCTIVCVWF